LEKVVYLAYFVGEVATKLHGVYIPIGILVKITTYYNIACLATKKWTQFRQKWLNLPQEVGEFATNSG
jgi:hypothetical protein